MESLRLSSLLDHFTHMASSKTEDVIPRLNWRTLLLLLCLAVWSDGRAQGQVSFGESVYFGPNQLLELDWTVMVGARRLGLVQNRQVRDMKGGRVFWVDTRSPQNYQWQRYTTVHLGLTQFTTRSPAWVVVTLANALLFALALTLLFWKRSQRGRTMRRRANAS